MPLFALAQFEAEKSLFELRIGFVGKKKRKTKLSGKRKVNDRGNFFYQNENAKTVPNLKIVLNVHNKPTGVGFVASGNSQVSLPTRAVLRSSFLMHLIC